MTVIMQAVSYGAQIAAAEAKLQMKEGTTNPILDISTGHRCHCGLFALQELGYIATSAKPQKIITDVDTHNHIAIKDCQRDLGVPHQGYQHDA